MTTLRWTAILTAALLAGAGCAPADGADAPAASDSAAHDHSAHDHSAHDHSAHAEHSELPADDPADFSIFHAASMWTDQHGRTRPIESLGGRVQVVGMVYTSCGDACPRMLVDMKRIEGELGDELRDRVGFVLVTLDPDRDTPEHLGEYATGARLDPDRWSLLHGAPDDILELAALLGVQYRRLADGEFVHSNLLTVLDADGRVVHRQMGLGADPAVTLATIRALIAD